MVLAWAIYSGIPLIAMQYNINIDRSILLTARMGRYGVKVALLRCLIRLIIINYSSVDGILILTNTHCFCDNCVGDYHQLRTRRALMLFKDGSVENQKGSIAVQIPRW